MIQCAEIGGRSAEAGADFFVLLGITVGHGYSHFFDLRNTTQ